MLKKLIAVTALSVPFAIASPVKSFEFPDKLPYGEISANVSYYSQYVWRGERQNDGQSAVQGGLDYGVTLLDTYIDAYVGFWGSNVSGGTNTLSGNELDYYGGFAGAVPLLEDYFSYDVGFLYYDYPGMTDENTANGARNVDFFEYYASVGLAVPNTPFTISGAAGFTGNEMEGGNAYTDYIASISTSAFGVDLGLSFTTIDGYGGVNEDIESDQIIFSIGKSF